MNNIDYAIQDDENTYTLLVFSKEGKGDQVRLLLQDYDPRADGSFRIDVRGRAETSRRIFELCQMEDGLIHEVHILSSEGLRVVPYKYISLFFLMWYRAKPGFDFSRKEGVHAKIMRDIVGVRREAERREVERRLSI